MKVDIITLHAVNNYGSVLQAFATQELLKKHGCNVTIINYIRENMRSENLLKTWSKGNIIKKLVMLPTIKRWKNVFDGFRYIYLNLTDKIYTTEDDFVNYPLNADIYCTGSDQVWNSKWNEGIIPPLYLSFVPSTKYKFAFAASFGQDLLLKEEVENTFDYIFQYNTISVREKSAVKILTEQYGYKTVVHVLDPSLMLEANVWRKYSDKRKIKDDYILIYNLNRSKAFDNYAVELAKRTGLKLMRLCTRYDQFFRSGKSILIPDVFDFINLIDNAKYVITDSFHATAFCMNLNTSPICVYPPEFGGRLENFLTLTESMQCHVKNYDDFDVINRPVNFEKVNDILERERKKVSNYIDNVLTEARKFYDTRSEKN